MRSELNRIVNQLALGGRGMVHANIIKMETDRGFEIVPVGSVEWLSPYIWQRSSVVSRDGNRIRLVLLEAQRQKQGAFTRLVDDIQVEGLIPVVIAPHDRLAQKLHSWGWKCRRVGLGVEAEHIWYPRP
jgi:hypothetical protein